MDTITIPNTARYYHSLTLQRTPNPRAGTREGSEGLFLSYVDKKSLNSLSPWEPLKLPQPNPIDAILEMGREEEIWRWRWKRLFELKRTEISELTCVCPPAHFPLSPWLNIWEAYICFHIWAVVCKCVAPFQGFLRNWIRVRCPHLCLGFVGRSNSDFSQKPEEGAGSAHPPCLSFVLHTHTHVHTHTHTIEAFVLKWLVWKE